VAVLRNPIDRAYSHYLHNLRLGKAERDLGDHLKKFFGRYGAEPWPYIYLSGGLYADHIDFPVSNAYRRPRSRFSSMMLRSAWMLKTARRIVDDQARPAVTFLFFSGRGRPDLEPAARSQLADFFADDVEVPEQRLGHALPWPDFVA
jgi:hypothetical protein